jgi:hypothetical protein
MLLGYFLLQKKDKREQQNDVKIPNVSAAVSSSARARKSLGEGDGERLLKSFLEDHKSAIALYEEYKKSLSPAADKKQALYEAMDSVAKVMKNRGADHKQLNELSAVMKVRFYQWMIDDPSAALEAVSEFESRFTESLQIARELARSLVYDSENHVIDDVIAEKGLIASLAWVRNLNYPQSTIAKVLTKEIKEGGGMAHFRKVEQEINELNEGSYQLMWHMMLDDGFMQMAAALPLSDAQDLLDYVSSSSNKRKNRAMLVGYASSGKEAASWLLEQIASGNIPEAYATSVAQGLGNQVLSLHGMDLESRVAARRFTSGNEKKDRDSIVSELMSADVNRYLNNGRDWRFEFRHGNASLEEITAAMNQSLRIPPDGRDDAMISLYKNLAEENPAKALRLLDGLTEEKRRFVLFDTSWNGFGGINPNEFYSYLQSLPAAVTAQEKSARMKGWDWNARHNLHRYGDDYITWVKTLPEGPDKAAALNSLIWATREVNDAEANRLSRELYTK